MGQEKMANFTSFRSAAIFCLLAIGYIFLGIFYYRHETQLIMAHKYEGLSAIANLKSDSINEWRRHRLADVRRASLGALVRRDIADLLQDPMNPGVRAELQTHLNISRQESVYEDALFLDTRGNILLTADPDLAPVEQTTIKAIEIALKDRKEVISDFFRAPKGSVYIDVVAPVLDNSNQPIAIMVLRSNASKFLYPFIQAWPTPSRTAETLLVCRDGDSVLFLNELRHSSKTALTLRLSLTYTHVPSVQAVLGNYGKFRGKDYRGVDVLAVSQPIPESPWFLVVKVDEKEILPEVRYRVWVVAIIVLLLILISAGLIITVYRKRQEIERKQAEDALRESEGQLKSYIDGVGDAIYVLDVDTGQILNCNSRACLDLGYSRDELVKLSATDIESNISSEDINAIHHDLKPGEVKTIEGMHKRKDGSVFPVEVRINLLSPTQRNRMIATVRDITERKQMEDELRINEARYRKAQSMGHVGNWEYNLQACDFWGSDEAKRIYGFDPEQADFSTDEVESCIPERERVHQALVDLIELGKIYNLEFEILPRNSSEPRIIASIAELQRDEHGEPLKVVGVIQDITEPKRTEEALRESEEKYRTLFEESFDGLFITSPTGKILDMNKKGVVMFGYETKEELLCLDLEKDIYAHPPDRKRIIAMVNAQGTAEYEVVVKKKSGEKMVTYCSLTAVKDKMGVITSYRGIIRDITERKLAEEALRTSLVEKEVLLREVHHRVKNNLASIGGLIRMQRRGINHTATVAALTDLESRILSIAIVHEKLYRSENLARIDLQNYLDTLISGIRTSFGARSDIRFLVEAKGVEMVLDDAIPCGLIINEVITNAIKHAFPQTCPCSEASDCEIAVTAKCEGATYTLTVSDNGVGFPADMDWTSTKTLGLDLVRMLGRDQLGGQIELEREGGTRFILKFNSQHSR